MEETISLQEIFAVLKKRLAMILLITVVATAISGLVSYFILTPIYQSSTQILVNQSEKEQSAVDVNQVRTNLELINTYNVIIKNSVILEKVITELNLEQSVNQLENQITVSNEQNSQVVAITVQDPNPAAAVDIANTVASVFQAEITNIMNVDNVNILSEASLAENPSPVKPSPMLNMAIAFVIGLMVGTGLAFLLDYLDNTLKTEQDIEQHLGLPVVGSIAFINGDELSRMKVNKAGKFKLGKGETLES